MATTPPRILTNMAFRQSADWREQTESLYDLRAGHDTEFFSAGKEAWLLWRRRPGYEVVLTLGARTSLLYGWLCALTRTGSKQIMTEVFIDQPRPGHPIWRLKVWAYRFIAHRAIGILTNSSAEVHTIAVRFAMPENRLRYVPMHSNIKEPRLSRRNEGFVLSAGRTLRDYSALLKAAALIKAPLIIICGRDEIPNDPAANVTVLQEIDRIRYLDYLERCAVVALPLLSTERSTGQVVLLEAMALGKPVVATRSPGTQDHIRSGENGLLVPPGEVEALAREVNFLLEHPDAAERLARQALDDTIRHHTFDAHARAKLQAIAALWENHG